MRVSSRESASCPGIPVAWVGVLTAALLVLSATAGWFAGKRRFVTGTDQSVTSEVDVVLGAIFGLLGLLLAFSFGIAEDRFSKRRALILEEASAIETAYLRATAVAGEHSEKLQRLLREYAALRGTLLTPTTAKRALDRAERLHVQMWKEGRQLALAAPDSEAMALLLESLGDVIVVHEARIATVLYQRLSTTLLMSLYALSMLSMVGLGYKGGLARSRSMFSVGTLAIAISTFLLLIVDLERPWQGLFEVNPRALQDVQRATRQAF